MLSQVPLLSHMVYTTAEENQPKATKRPNIKNPNAIPAADNAKGVDWRHHAGGERPCGSPSHEAIDISFPVVIEGSQACYGQGGD